MKILWVVALSVSASLSAHATAVDQAKAMGEVSAPGPGDPTSNMPVVTGVGINGELVLGTPNFITRPSVASTGASGGSAGTTNQTTSTGGAYQQYPTTTMPNQPALSSGTAAASATGRM